MITWKRRYAPETTTAQNRLPWGMKTAYEKMKRPSVMRLIEKNE